MQSQREVDEIIALRAMQTELKDVYDRKVQAYRDDRLSQGMPKGDTSQLGDVTICYNKPKDPEVVREFVVTDVDALLADGSEDFAEYLAGWVKGNIGRAAEEYFYEVGELLDGCEIKETVMPGEPKSFRCVQVKPTKEMRTAAAAWIGAGIAGFLGGGE